MWHGCLHTLKLSKSACDTQERGDCDLIHTHHRRVETTPGRAGMVFLILTGGRNCEWSRSLTFHSGFSKLGRRQMGVGGVKEGSVEHLSYQHCPLFAGLAELDLGY